MNFSVIAMFMKASLLVQLVMSGLILSSVISWAIIFNRSRCLALRLKLFHKFQALLNSGIDILGLYKQVSAQKYKIGIELIFFKGVTEFLYLSKNNHIKIGTVLKEVKRSMSIVLSKEQEILEKNLSTLATIQSISPYIGLFGTIWGIMSVFHQLGVASGQATLAVVAPGISEALIATAMGLVAAIPAGIFYNKFIVKIDRLINGYYRSINELINIIGKKFYVNMHKQYSLVSTVASENLR